MTNECSVMETWLLHGEFSRVQQRTIADDFCDMLIQNPALGLLILLPRITASVLTLTAKFGSVLVIILLALVD